METIQAKRALVTGASSGLGVDFARQLAALKADLVLVARRRDRLEDLADELRAAHGVQVDVVPMDIGDSDAPIDLYELLKARGLQIDILVNNAGFGLYGNFLDLDWEREQAMLQLDILTLVHLTKLFARDMASRGWGRILQVASIGAYQPCPTYASYGAAKSFVLNFSEAINYELRGSGVSCSAVSPGVTKTEFHDVSGQDYTPYQKMVMMQSKDVVREGISAMLKGKPSVVPGFANKLTVFSLRLFSRSMATAVAYMTMRAADDTPKTRLVTGG
ncbi:MAG: oxidoreductase [Candidatus Melainabacteria bacterium HGW-Melainabacteria-1]|nr:MAG: oxidoreductase [Candidatus Melainabacteria bacterium HGW-Melainabacteria-1]